MYRIIIFVAAIVMFASAALFSQQPPPRPRQGPPNKGPDKGAPRPGDAGNWIRALDTNRNEILELEEFRAAAERTFAEIDADGNGKLDATELRRIPRPQNGPPRSMQPGMNDRPPGLENSLAPRPGEAAKGLLPPLFFDALRNVDQTLTRAEFDAAVNAKFKEMDRNGDGAVGRLDGGPGEIRPPGPNPPPAPNAKFLSAELSFGDRLILRQPFSAETVLEHTRRLFDGSTVKKEMTGAIYRDSAGRTRREQPLDVVGTLSVSGVNETPVRLIFINDFPAGVQYSFEATGKIARKTPILGNQSPSPVIDEPRGSRSESVGTRTIEGVSCEMTRVEREIPVGAIGNDKSLKSTSEKCFSPELQLVIMSESNDPIGGYHSFRLKNIKRAEPSADLFTVPNGVKIEPGNYK